MASAFDRFIGIKYSGAEAPISSLRNLRVYIAEGVGGDPRWRRLTDVRGGTARSIFQFYGRGSVAKSTHAGLPWLLFLRRRVGARVHFWPFDGWDPPAGQSVVLEVCPALWSRGYAQENRSPDQHDAYSIARGMRDADRQGLLPGLLNPHLEERDRKVAEIEGWILGLV